MDSYCTPVSQGGPQGEQGCHAFASFPHTKVRSTSPTATSTLFFASCLSRTLTPRQWFLIFTCLILLSLAFLGFTNFSHSLPLNDKLLHFLCMGLATAVFYFIFDVEE